MTETIIYIDSDTQKKLPTVFNGIREAHEAYNYPGSFAHGIIHDEEVGVIRIYDNSAPTNKIDREYPHLHIVEDYTITYWIDITRPKIRKRFEINLQKGNLVRYFKKRKDCVEDLGLWKVRKVEKNYVTLKRNVASSK